MISVLRVSMSATGFRCKLGRTFPAITNQQLTPFAESIFVDGVARVDQIKQYVVEQRLEGGNTGPFHDQQGGEGIGASDADSQYLTGNQNEPEIPRLEECELLAPCLLLLVPSIDRSLGAGFNDLRMPVLDWRGGAGGGAIAATEVDAGSSDGSDVFGIAHGEDQSAIESIGGQIWSFVKISERKTPEVARCGRGMNSLGRAMRRGKEERSRRHYFFGLHF